MSGDPAGSALAHEGRPPARGGAHAVPGPSPTGPRTSANILLLGEQLILWTSTKADCIKLARTEEKNPPASSPPPQKKTDPDLGIGKD